MDPHAERGAPTVEVAEVDVEFDLKVRERARERKGGS
jgi:hypothetical protein